jgi:U3 small nucleolar ribonucleoprotein protein IMP4
MSIRRDIRLRKEFLLRKQQESQLVTTNEKKRQLRDALESDHVLPTELRSSARELNHQIEMDIHEIEKQKIDDEYANVGLREPKICVTTSRDPGNRLKQFAKEVKLCFPNSQAINRGNYRIDELVEACKKADFTDLILLNETRGNPDAMIISHLPYGPTAYFTLSNSVLRHDIPECKPASQAYPQLIIDGMNSKIGKRISQILSALYPIPKPDVKRIITYANQNDYISFRHHMYAREGGQIILQEAGPRFELRPYEIRLGTLDQEEAEKEWVLRPYMNTARKKQALSS